MATQYTILADVKAYYMEIAGDTPDYITDAQITRFISEASLEIDIKLRKKYVLPFSDATDLNFLKSICEKNVVCKIDKIIRANSSDDENKDFAHRRGYCKEWKQMIDDIISGKIELDAQQKSFKPMKYNKSEAVDESNFC